MTDPNDKRKAAIKRLEAGRAFKLQAACDDLHRGQPLADRHLGDDGRRLLIGAAA